MKRLLFALALASPALAHAGPSARECIAANERGNSLRKVLKLRAAQNEMLSCADPSCPDDVRAECSSKAAEIGRSIPSLVVHAIDASGRDLADVKLTLDGVLVATPLEGAAISLDPGAHEIALEAPGQLGVLRRQLVLGEGEKDRVEVFRFRAPEPASLAPAPPSHPSIRRTLGLATGIAGALGLGFGLLAGAVAMNDWSASTSACAKGQPCPSQDAYSTASAAYANGKTWADVSTVACIAGGVVLAVGGVLFFTAPYVKPGKASAVGLTLGVSL